LDIHISGRVPDAHLSSVKCHSFCYEVMVLYVVPVPDLVQIVPED
jgi:hypothetical protein